MAKLQFAAFCAMLSLAAAVKTHAEITATGDVRQNDEKASVIRSSRKSAPSEGSEVADWSHGSSSWQQAVNMYEEDDLWTKPNYCDARVLHGSAPLTVLFGLSTFWDDIKKHRDSLLQGDSTKPFELHVLGSAYPFEGRSDWSLLASRRPADIPGVRVVLVLGTPWHQDNVPIMHDAKEFSEDLAFLQVGMKRNQRTPEIGKTDGGALKCKGNGELDREDKMFKKADLCRDHGNGLEVVCIEKYYQDAVDDLPKPDLVAMFSPGFPQIARRSWDQVLRMLLKSDVPIMVGDLYSTDKSFIDNKENFPKPGEDWPVKPKSMEDGMTFLAMQAYEARSLGAKHSPFPILIPRGDGDLTAKNSVLQLFRGRKADAQPFKMPSAKQLRQQQKILSGVHLERHLEDPSNAKEITKSLGIPTSTAYDKAMWLLYKDQARSFVEKKMHEKEDDDEWMDTVEDMGLTGKKRSKPWTFDEWLFVLSELSEFADTTF